MTSQAGALLAAAAFLVAGCHREAPAGSLVLTQTPAGVPPPSAATVMDARYPPGSRVVLLAPPLRTDAVEVLSGGLSAAGDPCVSWDGRWVYFAGKATESSEWQIYRVRAGGGSPERVTQMPGGAMDPAVAAHGELVFSSPVPKAGRLWTSREPAALYGQWPGQAPRRLTFGPDGAADATVLRDGRVLYVSAAARDGRKSQPHLCLFTINNDGTEVTAYAGQDDGVDGVRRPRELGDGRVAFLAGRSGEPGSAAWAEGVRTAAPFATRANLFAFPSRGCRSVEPTPEGDLLACVDTRGMAGRSMAANAAVYRVGPGASALGAPVFDDPQWDSIEAAGVARRDEPAGHTSIVMPGATHGTILCLNVNDSCEPAAGGGTAHAAGLRITALAGSAPPRVLGTVPVAADGSVLVRLPAGVPLGFDTLDAGGRVLRHQPPGVWLQPGENRGCVGCHEARNHSPRNVRPQAVQVEPQSLDLPPGAATPRTPAP
jgi:hypothetical protein